MEELLQKFKIPLGIALLGVIVVGIGFILTITAQSGPAIEIITPTSAPKALITADIEGEVIKPGVYQLKEDSRIDDLLVVAGGLAANADRVWVEQNLNRAGKLSDGAKIYIPSKSELTVNSEQLKVNNTNNKINANTASVAELDKLPGIGAVRAQAIIDNRPYGTTEEVKSKAKIPSNIWEQIKEKITVY